MPYKIAHFVPSSLRLLDLLNSTGITLELFSILNVKRTIDLCGKFMDLRVTPFAHFRLIKPRFKVIRLFITRIEFVPKCQ